MAKYVLAMLCLSLALALPRTAGATDDYPTRPITMIIPSSAGSGVDPAAQVVGQALSKIWGQRVIIENRGGAAGIIGYSNVASAKPDGYTVLFTTNSVTLSPLLIKNAPFNPDKDFAGISLVATLPIALAASNKLPVKTIADVIAMAKAQPGKLSFGSGGEGTMNDMAAVLFAQKAGIKILRVPYNGVVKALAALMGNELDFVFASTANIVPYVQGNLMKAIAVSTAERQPVLPNTPTIMETVPGYNVSNWYGIMGPAGLPPAVLARWTDALAKVKQDPAVQKAYANVGAVLDLSSPSVMDAQLHGDIHNWQGIISQTPDLVAQ